MLPIIPVIDLQKNTVVRGVAGKRAEYRPIESKLCNGSDPSAIANAFVGQFGFRTAYVADLDAIGGGEPNIAAFEALRAAGLQLWIDAGVRYVHELQPHGDVILGLESLDSPAHLAELVSQLSNYQQAIFSLDLHKGQPWTKAPAWRGWTPREIVEQALVAGITRVIVLDVAAVGSDHGPATLELGSMLHARWPTLTLIGGGGVRQRDDVASFLAAGYAAVLVASALHDSRIQPNAV